MVRDGGPANLTKLEHDKNSFVNWQGLTALAFTVPKPWWRDSGAACAPNLSAIPLRNNRKHRLGNMRVQNALAAAFESAGLDEAAAPALAEALHCLRVAVTLFDSNERLIFSNQHYNYLFRSLPARERL